MNHITNYVCIISYIYVIMKTMCPPSYHHNGLMASHALGHMMYEPYIMCPSASVAIKPLWWQPGGHIVFMITYILHPSWYISYLYIYIDLNIYYIILYAIRLSHHGQACLISLNILFNDVKTYYITYNEQASQIIFTYIIYYIYIHVYFI